MAVGNVATRATFSKLVSTTLENLPAEVFDAVSTNNALLYMLQKRGNLKVVSGGRSFTHPIYYKANTSFKSYAKTATIDTPLMDDITRAEYPIKIIGGSVVISLLEEAMNAGNKEKLIDLVEETVTRAKISMAEELGNQVFKDGTGDNDFDGLQHLISAAPSVAPTDVGGINPATTGNEYWRNQIASASGTDFSSSAAASLAQMSALVGACTFGRQGPRIVVTTKTLYAEYEGLLSSNLRYVTTELGEAGFMHLAYQTMPVVFDDNCPSLTMYFIDTDNLWLQVLARGNMELTDMQPSHDQLLRVALLYLFGNLTTGSRRTNGYTLWA
jgi:hypothetical protein